MKYLLDTHVLVWWYLDHKDLPKKYAELLERLESEENEVGLSVISLWEVAKLLQLKRLSLNIALDDWLEQIENDPWIEVIPLDSRIISESTRLPDTFPKDPSDQLIVATARCLRLKLLTCDERIAKSRIVTVV